MRKKVASGSLPATDPAGSVAHSGDFLGTPAPTKAPDAKPAKEKVQIPVDAANEAAVIVAAYLDPAVRAQLLTRLVGDHFQQREHRLIWMAFQEAERKKLVLDFLVVEQIAGDDASRYLVELLELKPEAPKNLGFHLQCILWDHARATAARGPIPAFIEALRDPKAEPERVRGLSRAITQCFDGYEDRKHLHDGDALVRDQTKEIELRARGLTCWNYGVPGLDYVDRSGPRDQWRRRMIPGMAPGMTTVITGISGAGKSTVTANIVLGTAFPGWQEGDLELSGRNVLYGAWEMNGGMMLEILSALSFGWKRSEMFDPVQGGPNRAPSPILTPEGRSALRERMALLATRIKFLGNPFRRRTGEKASNDRNLDILQGYIADSGCEVFVADLWKRALRSIEPDDEEEALIRQQSMAEELRVHVLMLQQQRLKDIEQRADKRPTREGIKGSSAWVEIPDAIIGVHRPFLFKRVADDSVELLVLKQRYGRWPLGVAMDWDPETGKIWGGRPIEYDRPGEVNEIDAASGLGAHMRRGR